MRFSGRACSVETDRFGCVQRGDGRNIHMVVHSAAEGTTERVTLGARGCREWEVNGFRASRLPCWGPIEWHRDFVRVRGHQLPPSGGSPRSSSTRVNRDDEAPRPGCFRGVGPGHRAPGCVSGGADKYPRKVPRRKAGVLLVRVGDTSSRHGAWFVRTGPYALSRVRSRRGWCSQPLPLPSAGTLDRATPAILCLVKAHGWPVVTGRADREQGQAHLPAEQP
ncbi:hypothetical protein FHR84_004156 [Actinopolyspora biskrensis]|uniref:Uncharacterized protein n=1 Tax=Actinopolyspora biskrensis TaxID=1470178 RepID=A0A852Z2L9_9ACTN|nr:hypothetical protein [Actinopolyspora biskrensis]